MNDLETSAPKLLEDKISAVSNPLPETRKGSRNRGAIGLVLFFICGMWFGWTIHGQSNLDRINAFVEKNTKVGGAALNIEVIKQVWGIIKAEYVEQPVDEKVLIEGILNGVVAGLNDPYSLYFTDEESKSFKREIQGDFEGIGAEIGTKDGELIVIAPLAESPAEKAGIKPGDIILKIDNEDAGTMSLDQAVEKLRGQKGTSVNVEVLQQGNKLSIDITRDVIKINSVEVSQYKIGEKDIDIARIKINSFNDSTGDEFKNEIRTLVLNKPKAILLDLRNNPGGFFNEAVDIASTFIKEGEVIVIEEQGNLRENIYSKGIHELEGIPVVVLINNGTASASEIVAGALRDQTSAIIVGENSFGKGTVQDFIDLDNGGSLKLTVARWLTPNGSSINSEGIKPDIEVVNKQDDRAESQKDEQLGVGEQEIIKIVK